MHSIEKCWKCGQDVRHYKAGWWSFKIAGTKPSYGNSRYWYLLSKHGYQERSKHTPKVPVEHYVYKNKYWEVCAGSGVPRKVRSIVSERIRKVYTTK